MALNLGFLFFLLLSSTSPFLADGVFQVNGGSGTGRNLLQDKNSCPVNFEFQNYTIITSKCKGPSSPAPICCAAFTEFACPFRQVLNDESNNCASIMFSYINLYGKYPAGLFASECPGTDKNGLACDGSSNQTASANGGQGDKSVTLLSLASTVLVSGLGALLFY